MKTKFYWVALLASAAMIAQAKAGGHHGGGGGAGFAMARPAPAHDTEMIPGIASKTAAPTSDGSMSLRDAQPIGIAIGTGAMIIGGMGIVANSSTASGSSMTRDSILTIIGIRTATATTHPTTIPMATIPACMK